jgi:hypothetical protein
MSTKGRGNGGCLFVARFFLTLPSLNTVQSPSKATKLRAQAVISTLALLVVGAVSLGSFNSEWIFVKTGQSATGFIRGMGVVEIVGGLICLVYTIRLFVRRE